jgi:hypothetical protein
MRNNQQMHKQFRGFFISSVASYIFRPPNVAFNEHLHEDSYNSWPKHLGGYADHYMI